MLLRITTITAVRATPRALLTAATLLVAGAACSDDDPVGPGGEVAAENIQVQGGTDAGPLAIVTFSVRNADSARALYVDSTGAQRATAFVPVSDGQARVVVPGLAPATSYDIQGEARNGSDSAATEPASVTTEALPADLQNVSIETTTGTFSSDYILTEVVTGGNTLYAVAFDSTGQLVWYRRFADYAQIGDLQQQPNGHFSIYLGGSTGWQPVPGQYDEFTVDGTVTHTWTAPAPYYTDGHDLRLVVNDTTVEAGYLFGYDQHPLDMTAHGGGAAEPTAVHQIFRLSPSGDATLLFNAIDHWTPDDWVSPPLTNAGDIDHPNSLDFDSDGNIVVSWRNLGAITKHDGTTGALLWQFGGTKSDITLSGDPLGGFGGQHFARALPDGHILLFDNGTNHDPKESRAAEYAIDESNNTATFVWDYQRPSILYSEFMGSTKRLANGNTLIGYSLTGVITEVASTGSVVAEGTLTVNGNPTLFYRAIPIVALDRYERP
ncbi:MAG TPA: aryl-sulfate sulfotransferase [Gemmatimonadaceae bacterium]